MDTLMMLCLGITGINIVLILSLMYVYVKNLLKIRSSFTAGLVIFTGLFLIHDIAIFISYMTLTEYYVPEIKLFVFGYSVLQALAFSVLNILTWK
jgi:hypothetical protein